MPYQIDPPPGENEVECGRCGAIVHISLSRCPECGVNLYEPEDDTGERLAHSANSSNQGRPGFLTVLARKLKSMFGKEDLVDELFSGVEAQMILFQDLVRKVGGDRAAAERLVAYEKQRHPEANRIVCLKRAISRWETDNS